jgi:hypothetical protein
MLSWLIDNAGVVYFLLGIVLLGLGVSWWLNRRVRTLAYMLGVAALIGVVWLLTVFVPTDRKRIEASLWAMARAILDDRPDELVKHWSRDFEFQGLKRDALAEIVTETASNQDVESINLWEFDFKKVEADKAEVWFRCVAKGRGGGTFLAICHADFVKEAGDWKLRRAAFFQPVANTDQEIRIPIGR